MLATAIGLCVLAALLITPGSYILASARWVAREPRAALVLWQALGLAAGFALVGCAITVALAPMGQTPPIALRRAGEAFMAGDPDAGLGFGHTVLLVAALALLARLWGVTGMSAWRMWRARARHRDLVDLLATPLGNPRVEVQVIEHAQVAAYCLPGHRWRVVVTTAALQLLTPAELDAVLAHELAHVRERHDLVVLPFIAWAQALRVSGARCAKAAVAHLIELVADDSACSAVDRRTLAAALARCGIAAGRVPEGALAVTGSGVLARVERLLAPQQPSVPIRLAAYATAFVVLVSPLWVFFTG